MVRSHYPHLLQQRRRWFVRMVVPVDVRDIIGQSVFKVPTGHTDKHRAATVAAPIIAQLQERIRTAREAGKRLEQVTAEQLAERYRTERAIDPDMAAWHRLDARDRAEWYDGPDTARSYGITSTVPCIPKLLWRKWVHSNGYVPGTFGIRAISTVWCGATSTTPSAGADEPGGKLLAAINFGALKSCPPSLSFTK
jgi:hypothetical protein